MDQRELLSTCSDRLQLASRNILFSEGEAADVIYLLVEGRIELLVSGRAVESLGPGAFLGELALIEPDQPRPYSARALTDCELVRIDEARFEQLVAKQPHFAVELMRIMAERLRRHELAPA